MYACRVSVPWLVVVSLLAAVLLCGTASARTVSDTATVAPSWESDYFQSPTGNIRCRYFYAANPLMACVTLNDTAMVGVRACCRPGFRRWGTGNHGFPPGPTLQYGQTWRSRGEFKCKSYFDRMECWSVQSGHGFWINRAAWSSY
jgi:hypothetical protein